MPLPIILLVETHWDTTPKKVINKLLPELRLSGYDCFAIEAPQGLTTEELLARPKQERERVITFLKQAKPYLETNQAKAYFKEQGISPNAPLHELHYSVLVKMLLQLVTTTHAEKFAEGIKHLPANIVSTESYQRAISEHFVIKPIDIDDEKFSEILDQPLSLRMKLIDANAKWRDQTQADNIIKLYREYGGVLAKIGASHAEGVMAILEKKGLGEEVLCYFIHSSQKMDDFDHLADLKLNFPLLKNRAIFAETPAQLAAVTERILQDVKMAYKEIDDISHTRLLKKLYGLNFRAIKRASCIVDVVVDATDEKEIERVNASLNENKIPTVYRLFQGKNMLTIPEINTPTVSNILWGGGFKK